MFTAFYTSAEMVAFTLTSLALLSFAAATVSFLGLSWSSEKWRIPETLVGTACIITAVYYAGAAGLASAESHAGGKRARRAKEAASIGH